MNEVKICDVTLRDGMQALNRNAMIPINMRLKLLEALQRSGLPYIEVGSFVNPRVISSMRDTTELLAFVSPKAGQQIAALVPTLKYYQKFKQAPAVDTVALFISASEQYSMLNLRMTCDQAAEAAVAVARAARADGYRVRGYLSYAFRDMANGDPTMPMEQVERMSHQLLEVECENVALSDTDGRATPQDVERMVRHLAGTTGLENIGVHLHDRYGLGIANALIAYQGGVRKFDCSVGGVGGNKILPNSVGNIATEELVHLFHGMGVETGVDLGCLIDAGRVILDMIQYVGDPLPPSKILIDRLVSFNEDAHKMDVL